MKTYKERKENARQEAIEWQFYFTNKWHYWSDLADYTEHFRKIGKRYGLIREFEENGIL